MMKFFMVMSATTYDGSSNNSDRCFDFNATRLATLEDAQKIAESRNKRERQAGHTNVQWFACEQ